MTTTSTVKEQSYEIDPLLPTCYAPVMTALIRRPAEQLVVVTVDEVISVKKTSK